MRKELDEFKKLLELGTTKVEKVLYEITGMDISVKVGELLPKNLADMIVKDSFIMVQTISTEKTKSDIYFAMADLEFLKLLSALDENADFLDEDYLIDSFLEIGNIIIGNIISVLAYLLGKEVKICLPTLITREEFKNRDSENGFLSTTLELEVKDIDVNGYLILAIQRDIFKEIVG